MFILTVTTNVRNVISENGAILTIVPTAEREWTVRRMRPVDADYVIEKMRENIYEYTTADVNCVDDAPTLDVEPVRHRRWLRTDAYPHRIYCSECYATFIRNDEFLHLEDIPHNYCPNCGARMDEVEE